MKPLRYRTAPTRSLSNKRNIERRHPIAKMTFKVTSWDEDDAGLQTPGSLTWWVTEDVIYKWQAAPQSGRGNRPLVRTRTIEAGPKLRLAPHLSLRQTEGSMGSLCEWLSVAPSVPDHNTLSRQMMSRVSISRRYRQLFVVLSQ